MNFVSALAIAALLASQAPAAPPDAETETWDVVATMAAALAEPNEDAFMKPIAKSVEEHDYLLRQVRALVNTNDVLSDIAPVTNDGDDKERTLEVEWDLQIHPHSPGQSLIVRHETLKLTMVKTGKRWMITSLSPTAFFAAPAMN